MTVDREAIMKILPHRPPMLLVDEGVLEGEVSRCTYTVRGDEFFLQGHFPGKPRSCGADGGRRRICRYRPVWPK